MFSGIGYLRDNVPDGLEELLVYFDSTYISGTCRSIRCTTTGQQSSLRLRLRRQTPQFPPITWNVFDAVHRFPPTAYEQRHRGMEPRVRWTGWPQPSVTLPAD